MAVVSAGDIVIRTDSTSPAELYGGSWEQIEDVFLLSAGSTYLAGATGGEAEHTLTVDEMPSHTHIYHITSGSGSGSCAQWTGKASANWNTSATGGSLPHNNMPPYLVVYVWKCVEI